MAQPERIHLEPAGAVVAILLALFATAFSASSARSATAACPPVLLSEQMRSADVTFVAEVVRVAEDTLTGGFLIELRVEEVWHGPQLGSRVRLNDHRLSGRALEANGRYLVVAMVVPAGPDPVDHLTLDPCGAAVPLTPDLAPLRPADARVIGGGFTPAASAGEDATIVATLLGLLSVALLVLAVVVLQLRPRAVPRWAVPALGGTALIGALAAVMVLAGASGAHQPAAADATPSGTASASPSRPIEPEDPTLVVRLEEIGIGGTVTAASVHADGRLITSSGPGPGTLQERWLTDAGVDLVRAEVEATGLFAPDAPVDALYLPTVRPGAQPPGRDGPVRRITVSADGTDLTVEYGPILADEQEYYLPAPEIERADVLAQRLLTLSEWLPPEAWEQADPRDYVAERFRLTAAHVIGGVPPEVDLSQLAWPSASPPGGLPSERDASGRLTGCLIVTAARTETFLASLAAAREDPALSLAMSRTIAQVFDHGEGRQYEVIVEPLLPDERGCGAAPPAARPGQLAPGAVALVRVDDLRVRDVPSSAGRAIHAFAAGERVVVTTGPTAAEGHDWYEVRQGPGELAGWVSAGPPDDDPWLVPVSNGTIAFLRGQTIERMDADGGNALALADAMSAAWSPDGRLLALMLPPTDAASTVDIAVVAPDGSGFRRLTDGADPQWSPDGGRIAFVRYPTGGPTVFVMNADGSGMVEVTRGDLPSWSPDGSRIAFMRVDPEFRAPSGSDGVVPTPMGLWVRDMESGVEKAITGYGIFELMHRPSWSPDGSFIAYGMNHYVPADGGAPQSVTEGATWGGGSPWSPDGEHVIVMNGGRIAIQAVDSGELHDLVGDGVNPLFQPSWSPDGRSIVYSGIPELGAPPSIYIIPVGGGAPVRVGPEEAQSPAWQPVVSHPLQ